MRILTAILLLTLISIYPVYAENNQFKIHYDLEIIDPSNSLTKITAHFKNFPGQSVTLNFYPHYIPEGYLKADNLEVKNEKGNNINFYQEGNKYIISNRSDKNFSITYSLVMNQLEKGPIGYLCDSYLLSNCAWTFMIPENVTASEYSIKFKIPSGWTVITPFQKKDDLYTEKNFNRFISSTYGAGTFDVREETINGTNVKIALDSHFGKETIDKMAKGCFDIFRYCKSIFETTNPPDHLTIFARATGQHQWQFYNEAPHSSGEAIESINSAYYVFQHRVFHVFNGFRPYGMDIKPTWFMEGVDEYYFGKSLINIRYGKPFQDILYRYKDIYLKDKDKFDGPIYGNTRVPENFDKEQFLGYKKGSLVAYLLDREIYKSTSGKKSLDDVLKVLYKTYGSFKKPELTDEVIEETVSKVAGRDLSYFFNTYINNTGQIDLTNFFLDNDEDGSFNCGEEFLKTDLNNPDTDGDCATDYIEYKYNTDPLNKNSKPVLPLYIDGFSEDWNNVVVKSLKATDNTELDYITMGDSLYILMKFKNGVIKDEHLRYVLNMDLDFDNVPEIQVASIYGTTGDTLKFKKDMSTYGWKTMDDVNGLESAMSKVIEFKIPLSMLENKTNFQVFLGIWDTRDSHTLEGSNWLRFDL